MANLKSYVKNNGTVISKLTHGVIKAEKRIIIALEGNKIIALEGNKIISLKS